MRQIIFAALLAACAAAPGDPARAEPEAPAASERFVAGLHYHVFDSARPTSVAPGKVEVAEIFWYGCPHCYRLSPHVEHWNDSRPEAAELVRIPAVLNPGWHAHARLYYATVALGVVEQTHDEIFTELHVEPNPLNTLAEMVRFLERFGVDEAAAREALTSFDVEAEVRRADARVRGFRISGVPAIVVNGRYVASVGSAGGHEALLELIDHLVALETAAAATGATR
ncbi:MAG TPA: thiol:disulfide interchange protein DsbA/DsbL [Gammaproteobacteria bacterium]|nr:thiol:disulfide interchange protein DsbA/DsbL [Gammaproteobacteria bacterium]